MQASFDMPATPSFDPHCEPLQMIDPEPNKDAPADFGTHDRFCEDRLIRLWYSTFSDSFVE